jgi:hypothetical protein
MAIDIEKIKAKVKELELEDQLPDIPEDIKEMHTLAMLPLDFQEKQASLKGLGQLMALADIPEAIVICNTTGQAGGHLVDVLCVASVNLKAPDNMVLIPYAKEDDDDVAFGEVSEVGAVEGDIRDSIVEGFLNTESNIHLHENPDEDTDAYVDALPTQFPNMEGALNGKDGIE